MSSEGYSLRTAGGLQAFDMGGQWYVFLPALAKVVDKVNGTISVLLKRHVSLQPGEGDSPVIIASRTETPVEWNRLVTTYTKAKVLIASGGELKRKRAGPPHNLTIYPLRTCVQIIRHYSKDVDPAAARAIEAFWLEVCPDEAVADADEESKDRELEQNRGQSSSKDGQGELINDDRVPGRMKREPVSYLQFPTIMKGHRIIIDLTRIGEDSDSESVDALLSALSDNFLASVPPASVDLPLKRTYRLSDDDISVTLKDQCIKFGEWRSALWSWSRDEAAVSTTTFDGNISNLLLFAGYATVYAPTAYRITPPLAFDLSVVFGSQKVLEPLVIGYLRWLRRERRVMFSTTEGYLNSLVVMANFYFADTTNSSFDAGRNGLAVKSGLRRLRSHAHAAAQKEGKQKPVHPHWISWRACQWTRRRAAREYLRREGGDEGRDLERLYKELETKRKTGTATVVDAKKILHHRLYVRLQQLVAIYLHTIAPPVRVAITRCLQFKSTFVKLRADPSRYCIDLKNNPNSPSARHKTSYHYRGAIFPQASVERMTYFIDKLRYYKLTELKKAGRYVFINSLGEPFADSAWTAFVKRSWGTFSRAPSEDDVANAQPPRQPPPSLCRQIFVTWLNSVPYCEEDRSFLDDLAQSAADFQTHTLETANSLYDKDAASYERLLDLMKVCEKYSLSVTGGDLLEERWDENLDSDDDQFKSTGPVPRKPRAENSEPEAKEKVDEDEDQLMDDASMGPPASEPIDVLEDDGLDDDASPLSAVAEKLYTPEQILDRDFELVYKKKKGRYGATRKKLVGWRQRILVKWAGFSVAEATWETDIEYHTKWNSAMVEAREQAEIPQCLLKHKTHPVTEAFFYQVKWQNSNSTTMETAEKVEHSDKYRDVLRQFNDQHSRSSSSRSNSGSSSSSSSNSSSSSSRSSSSSGGATLIGDGSSRNNNAKSGAGGTVLVPT